MKKAIALFLLFAVIPWQAAWGEAYQGQTVAGSTKAMITETSGVLETLLVREGQRIQAGETLAQMRVHKVFATQNGVVARCMAEPGAEINGSAVEVTPENRYVISCTSENAFESPRTQQIHCGEKLYIRCVNDGTHRAIGIVTQISGSIYQVTTIGGTLYNGESVRLYRKEGYPYREFVGLGTAVPAQAENYEAQGKLIKLYVTPGETVERGQLLFTYTDSGETQLVSAETGIVTQVEVRQGDTLSKDAIIAYVMPADALRIEIQVETEAAVRLAPGTPVTFLRADDPEETPRRGTVESVSQYGQSEQYTVRIVPEETDMPIGMSVEVEMES